MSSLLRNSPVRRVGIAGAGFSGAVIARELAEKADIHCVVFDERAHIAGNCHTERDPETGILQHTYGPHIFNTNDEGIWSYVNSHGRFGAFTNRVKAIAIPIGRGKGRGVFGLPVNLHTINQFFGKTMNPGEAEAFVRALGDAKIGTPKNFEEQALKMLGRELYEAFFYGYTKKQWGCEPSELPASILKRLPVRFNYNDNYYDAKFQGIPLAGYTDIVASILNHPRIDVQLNTRLAPAVKDEFDWLIWSGPLDGYFGNRLGRLGYRSVFWERMVTRGDFQGAAVINYPGMDVPYTRRHEHKHFAPWETHEKTLVFTEYSRATQENETPYYPMRRPGDIELLRKYAQLVEREVGVSFVGRLGTYRYLDMDKTIGEALEFARVFLAAQASGTPLPVLSAPLF